MIRCIVYIRPSEFSNQKEDVVSGIYQAGERKVLEIIKDEGEPDASDPKKREGIRRILALAENKEFDELWCYSKLHISTDIYRIGEVYGPLRDQGISTIFLDDEFTIIASPDKELIGGMDYNEFREKRYKGMMKRLKQKKVMSRPPFGYGISKTGNLEIDEEKAIIIRRLFDEFDKPLVSLRSLSIKYNLSMSILRNIRSNPIYRTGEVRWAGKIAYYVEPIVPETEDQMLEIND